MLHGPVLVGTDLSDAARQTLREGVELARALHARLIVCHVIPELLPDGSLFEEFRRANLHAQESILAAARAAVQTELEAVLIGADDAAVDVVLDSGTAHDGLLRQAEEAGAGLVVIGPGAGALAVVRDAAAPVLVSRPSTRGPVVGATDFSDASLPALHTAAAEAHRRGVPLHLLHALDAGLFALGAGHAPAAALPYLAGSSPIALEGVDELRVRATERLRRMLDETGIIGEVAVVPGRAPTVIVEYAESMKAELVVVGTRGRSGFKRLTLGRTAASVIESAPCSVLVLRLRT
jgi:nucleotide-binding universal stress UspA family protein